MPRRMQAVLIRTGFRSAWHLSTGSEPLNKRVTSLRLGVKNQGSRHLLNLFPQNIPISFQNPGGEACPRLGLPHEKIVHDHTLAGNFGIEGELLKFRGRVLQPCGLADAKDFSLLLFQKSASLFHVSVNSGECD